MDSNSHDRVHAIGVGGPKPGRSRARRRRFVLWALLLMLAVGVAFMRLRPTKVVVVRVERKPLEQRIVVSGRVMPPSRVDIASLVTGRVVDVPVTEGQHVPTGGLLVLLDDREAQLAVRRARAAVRSAEARSDQVARISAVVVSESLRQADSRLQKANSDLARTKALADSGAVAPAELENAQTSLELAKSTREAAHAQFLGVSKMGADTRGAIANLEQARAELDSSTVRREQTRILAPKNAIVLTRSVEPGQVVQAGQKLLTLALEGETQLGIEPDERNLAQLAVGQPAIASADAFPDERFDAVVSYIAPLIDAQRGTIDVRLKVATPPPRLRPDMTVSVDVLVGRVDAALVVPSEAVRDLGGSAPWVLVPAEGKAVRRDIKLALRGMGMVEVLSGLAEGDLVLVPRGQKLSPGQRISHDPTGG